MRLVLVGASGYADFYYLNMLKNRIPEGLEQLAGIVDPFGEKSPRYAELRERGIPFFNTLDEFYARGGADLVMIVSPVQFHRDQVLTALKNGSHVLCEKPMVTVMQDAEIIRRALNGEDGRLGIAFQMSFCRPIQELKRDILDGVFGKPEMLKTFISWPRPNPYYTHSSWHGRARDGQGNWILDSILTNATAHYLHNIFFVLGENMESAAMPEKTEGSVYRAREIESFDTCFLRGEFASGARFYYAATHTCAEKTNPLFEYRFEKGVVSCFCDDPRGIIARFHDGREKLYGVPPMVMQEPDKILWMMRAARTGERPACTIQTVMPHLAVSDGVFDRMRIKTIPAEYLEAPEEKGQNWIRHMAEDMKNCYDRELLPDEAGIPWAEKSVSFRPAEIREFTGHMFRRGEEEEG